MSPILDITVDQILPQAADILRQQGVPEHAPGYELLLELASSVVRELEGTLIPSGVLLQVAGDDFARIYQGQGMNHPSTPLELIHPRAQHLALFVVTCGQPVCDRIRDLFIANEYPLGAALDAGASLAADQAAQVAQDCFAASLEGEMGVLRYSPGYCGWHISGQKALFERLAADTAGVSLTESCLMHPLKSVSGVIVAGRPDIHRFANDYSFCTECTGKECRERIQSVLTSGTHEV